ncbi:hypothetical protein FACS1894205_3910 [Alphaproteobacteria bacterium]|nr:hypothetical protein FACS1894205_3910 [Alphaproteobacteria bacterium]
MSGGFKPSRDKLRALDMLLREIGRNPKALENLLTEGLSPDLQKALRVLGEFEKVRGRGRRKKTHRPVPAFLLKRIKNRPREEAMCAPQSPEPRQERKTGIAPQPGGVPSFPEIDRSPEMLKKTLFLKNAKADAYYEEKIAIDGLELLTLESDGGCGLAFDEGANVLSGEIAASGDYQLRFKGALRGKPIQILAHLAVIPDPKSLWVSRKSDETDQFWKPDEASLCVDGAFFGIGASKRGRSHAKDGGFRDDDFGIGVVGGEWGIVVVADGAGSSRFSRRASQAAVESVLKELPPLLQDRLDGAVPESVAAFLRENSEERVRRCLGESLAKAAFGAAIAIEAEAEKHNASSLDFLTTLIICIARRIRGGYFFAGFSIGDGGAAVFDIENGVLIPLSEPDSGEFAGQTRFLRRSEFADFESVEKRIFFSALPRFTGLLAMTDGISDPVFSTQSQFANPVRWKEFWEEDLSRNVDFSAAPAVIQAQLLAWLDFWSPGNHDDRTIAALFPGRGTPS